VDVIGFFPPIPLDWLDAHFGLVAIVTSLALGAAVFGVAMIGAPR
jgi:hypothetical protein